MIGLTLMVSGLPGARVLRLASFVLTAERLVRLPLGFMLSLAGPLFVTVGARLGGKSVGGGRSTGASRLHRVSQGDVVDASSAEALCQLLTGSGSPLPKAP